MSYQTSPRQHFAFWSTLKQMAAKGACSASAQPGAYEAFKIVEQEAEAKQRYWGRIVYRSWPPPTPSRDRVA
jgi:hypothetical protein